MPKDYRAIKNLLEPFWAVDEKLTPINKRERESERERDRDTSLVMHYHHHFHLYWVLIIFS